MEKPMKTVTRTLLAFACVALPFAASAQSKDSKYCSALGDKYNTYVLSSGGKSHNTTPPDIANAISKCSSDSASAIPVLEKALNAAKVSLPARS
jgi:hypothetical protein